MRKLIPIIFLIATIQTARADYIITEDELLTLEITIQTQKELLTRQQTELTELKKEIENSRTSLQKARKSFDEYEAAALQIQETLQTNLTQTNKKLQNTRMAFAITVPVTAIAAAIIGAIIAVNAAPGP